MWVVPFVAGAVASQWLAIASVSTVFGRTRRNRHDQERGRDRDRNRGLQRERPRYDPSNERGVENRRVDRCTPSQRRNLVDGRSRDRDLERRTDPARDRDRDRDRPHPRDAGYVELRDGAAGSHTVIAPREDLDHGRRGLRLTSDRWVAARATVDIEEVR